MAKRGYVCSKTDCTFAITGTCLVSVDNPAQQCPNLKAAPLLHPETEQADPGEEVSENAEEGVRQFPTGLELGLDGAARVMRSRYTRLVGVLGQAEAGKTCLFTSMYLQLTGRKLFPRYRFIASETLLGFEQRARHLRDWSKGGVPEQIVDHTHLGQSRSPAFLHLAFHDDQKTRHDLLLPDLPGEWTSRLLSDASTADRFAFLVRADIILIVLEAPAFANPRTRNNALTDANHLLERLANKIRLPTTIPILLALTKCDQTSGEVPACLESVVGTAARLGYSASTIPLSAFPAEGTTIQSGFGIDSLIAHLTSPYAESDGLCIASPIESDRSFLTAGGLQ